MARFASELWLNSNVSVYSIRVDLNVAKDWFSFNQAISSIHSSSKWFWPWAFTICVWLFSPLSKSSVSVRLDAEWFFICGSSRTSSFLDQAIQVCIHQAGGLGWSSYYMRVTFFWLIVNLWIGAKYTGIHRFYRCADDQIDRPSQSVSSHAAGFS